MRPYLDKAMPEVWGPADTFSEAVNAAAIERGLSTVEMEYIKVRVSQLNGCAFCLDLHCRLARQAGITQQMLDLLPAWRESPLFAERETAVLAVAEAATTLPLTEESRADLASARQVLGDDAFAAAEWVAVAINLFNRVSILSEHPVRRRGPDGALLPRDPRP